MLKKGFKQLLAEAEAVVPSVSVQEFDDFMESSDTVLIDVRDPAEGETDGLIAGSLHVPRGMLEFRADPESPAYDEALTPEGRYLLYCATGGRSALAAKTLLDMGYREVYSLTGGYAAWKAERK